jgi:hypothetical protein
VEEFNGGYMTDKEIIRALRCCEKEVCADGDLCPLFSDADCIVHLHEAAIDLIERLTAENADLRKEIEWKDMVVALAQRKQAEAEAERDELLEKVPQWISVDDRHPKPGTRVLATDGVFVGEAYRTSADTWRRYDGIAMRDCIGSVVTHWMPLPEAPEEGEKA